MAVKKSTIQISRVLFSCVLLWSCATPALELSLADAEQVAIQQDPLVIKFQTEAQALMEDAIAAGQLPDPKLKIGIVNLPLDSFSFSQEPMTQTVIGVQQAFPSRGLLAEVSDKTRLLAEVERARAMERALTVLRGIRQSWMDVYFQTQARALVKESASVFDQLVKITQYQYRAGRGNQQDVLRAQIGYSTLKDKEISIEQKRDAAIAVLEKWTGASVRKHVLSTEFPVLPTLPTIEDLETNLEFHPVVAIAKAQLGAARKDVAIARAQYKPNVMLDVSYGARAGVNADETARADFLSAVVSVDIPFFTAKRQDKRLNARGYELNAASDAVDNAKRELRRTLDVNYADWTRLGERLDFYKSTVLPQAAQYSEASRKAYQSRASDFAALARARLRELEINLDALQLRVERAKAHFDLQYIAGES